MTLVRVQPPVASSSSSSPGNSIQLISLAPSWSASLIRQRALSEDSTNEHRSKLSTLHFSACFLFYTTLLTSQVKLLSTVKHQECCPPSVQLYVYDADKLLNLRTIFSQIKMMRILASHFVNDHQHRHDHRNNHHHQHHHHHHYQHRHHQHNHHHHNVFTRVFQ